MPIAAVVFDMDGLMIDSEPFWEASEIEAFARVGVSLTQEMCWQTTGLRVNEVVDYWYARLPWTKASHSEINRWILDGVINRILTNGQALPGVHETIELIKNHNVHIALASSSYYEVIDAVLKRLNLQDVFELTYSAEDEVKGKPDPAVYLTTANKLDVHPSKCLAIEDSANGLISAKKAGYQCIVVPDPRTYSPEKFTNADHVLKSLAEFDEDMWAQINNH